jgi:hypothetical protein
VAVRAGYSLTSPVDLGHRLRIGRVEHLPPLDAMWLPEDRIVVRTDREDDKALQPVLVGMLREMERRTGRDVVGAVGLG